MRTPESQFRILASVILVILLSGSAPIQGSAIDVFGDITQNTTWSDDTINVIGSIYVFDDVTLTIERGTTIIFHGYYYLKVGGTIKAEGREGDTIRFTRIDTSGFHNMFDPVGGWQGIEIRNNFQSMDDNDTSLFRYCIFEHAKGTAFRSWGSGGALHIWSTGRVKLENCVIRNNSSHQEGGGIFLRTYAHISIRNTKIHNNRAVDGGGIGIRYRCYPLIEHNKIYLNTALNNGGGIYTHASKELFISNKIANNYAGNRGGGIYNDISDNQFFGNILVNNEADSVGGGMLIRNCSPEILNNTICYNKADSGSAITFDYICIPKISNNVFWGGASDDNAQIKLSTESIMDITYCLLEGGKDSIKTQAGLSYYGNYDHNLKTNPMFVRPSAGPGIDFNGLKADWSVQANSPCLNGGNNKIAENFTGHSDPYHQDRVKYAIIDIGAVETQIPKLTVSGEITNRTSWVADSIIVEGDIFIRDSATLILSPGSVVAFKGYYGIDNQGVLHAVGSPEERIKFTAYDSVGFHDYSSTAGSWKGITMNNTGTYDGANTRMWDNDTTWLDYCIFEFGNCYANPGEFKSGGAIRVMNFSKVVLSNSILKNNVADISGALHIHSASNPIIANNIFHGNIALVNGGAIGVYVQCEPVIINNIISNNISPQAGGFKVQAANAIFINNIICNNTSESRGAVFYNNSGGVFSNNTIVNNRITSNNRGGLEIWSNDLVVVNSIIWGNRDNTFYNQIYSEENASFSNCIIENFPFSVDVPDDYSGEMSEISNLDPGFVSPSPGVGADINGLLADWSIKDFSPCINAGTADFFGDLLPDFDIAGNQRINGGFIDIGAYEHQGKLPQILKQPVGGTRCAGSEMVLEVVCSDSARYNWLKDGDTIQGATSSILVIDPVTMADQGNYNCLISNPYGSVKTSGVTLFVSELTKFISEPASKWVEEAKSVSFRTYYEGSNPKFTWQKDSKPIPGEIAPELTLENVSLADEGLYRCIISNTCGSDTSASAALYLAPQICMVTVSEITGNNLVVWEKKSQADIIAYNIYRESIAAGIYDLLATIPYNELSVYTDTSADPTIQAYIYKITAVLDNAGTETDIDLCKPHKTIHLIVSTNPEFNTTQLQWDRYYGFEYQSYSIFRSVTEMNFDKVYSLSSSLNSWADDPDPALGDFFYYRIAVEKPDACYPEGGNNKAGTGPYQHALSNMDDNKLKSTGFYPGAVNNKRYSIRVFPNPFTDAATIQFDNRTGEPYRLVLTDLSGKVYRVVDKIRDSEYLLKREGLNSGIYFVELRGLNLYRGKILIK